MLDIQAYYTKLANKEGVTENEVVELLKELAHYRAAAAYLASCHAANAEGLQKSACKSSKSALFLYATPQSSCSIEGCYRLKSSASLSRST